MDPTRKRRRTLSYIDREITGIKKHKSEWEGKRRPLDVRGFATKETQVLYTSDCSGFAYERGGYSYPHFFLKCDFCNEDVIFEHIGEYSIFHCPFCPGCVEEEMEFVK